MADHDFYREIFEQSSAAIAILDEGATISMVNTAFCELSGYTAAELTGTKWTDKLPAEEVTRLMEYSKNRHLEKPNVPIRYEARYITREHKIRSALFSVSFIKSRGITILTVVDITDKKEIEEQLKVSEERFRSIVESANDIVYALSPEGIFTYASPNWIENFGYAPEEIIGTSFEPLIHPSDLERIKAIVAQQLVTAQKLSGIEYRVRHKNGQWQWHVSNTSPIVDEHGKVRSIVGIARNITDQKKVAERLADSEFFFKESQRSANIGSYKADFVKGCWESSEVLDTIFGIDKSYDRSIDPGWISIIHPEDRAYMQNYLINEVIGKRKQFNEEYRIIRKSDGKVRWMNGLGKVLLNDQGEPVTLIGTIQDITDRKKAEHAIRENQIKLNIALKIARLGSWEFNIDENLFYFNDTFYAIFKTSTKEVGSNRMPPDDYASRFIYPDDRHVVADEVAKALEADDPNFIRQLEHRMLYADGSVGYITVRFVIVKNERGRTVRIIGINQDITAIREAENKLKESEADLLELNAMKDKFFSIIAHDLRSPFAAIINISQLLVENINNSDLENIALYSDMILKSSEKAMELLMNLMEWSRAKTGRMAFDPIDLELVYVVNDVVALLKSAAETKGISLLVDVPDGMRILAVMEMLNTILRNLISNAIKFTFPGGRIVVSAIEKEAEVVVRVADTGKGMSDDIRMKLFQIGETTSTTGTANEEGTGLGLILCKEFVEKHGGCIWVESEVGTGSDFYFSIVNK